MNAIRRFGQTSAQLSTTYERLSSGLRINHASDDAAGLAIASSLKTDTRVYAQGVRNVNDGISYLNVADGATHAVTGILLRMRELSTQASNGTYGSSQRQAMQAENLALQKEYNRIVQTTSFNGIQIFNGAASFVTLQAGYGSDGTLTANLAGNTGGDGTFTAKQDFTLGTNPRAVITGDYNGDGKLDLVTTDYGGGAGNTISIMLGNGDGSFGARQSFTTGTGPVSITTGDFNGDGRLDLVTADYGVGAGTTASVLLGNGDGSFGATQSFTAGTGALWTATSDFNGDGKLDLVTTDSGASTVSVLLGNGDGSFRARQSFTTGGVTSSVAIGDFNGDGKADLVTTDFGTNAASVLLGNGDGSFGARQSFSSAGVNIYSVATGDFNNDGKLDFSAGGSSSACVFIGNGDGTFGASHAFTAGATVRSIITADFNSDGKLDLVTADQGASTASVLLGNGDGSFGARQVLTTAGAAASIITGDLNGDGTLDLVAANFVGAANVSVLLGKSTPTSLNTIGGISLLTRADALTAQGQIDTLLANVSRVSGAIGSSMSRLGTTVSNLQNLGENLSSAASGIMDADIAEESAKLVRNQILQQATAAVLAQANQQPALALKLLGA